MGKVLSKNGFDVVIYTADHEPAHVHVFKSGKEAKIYLADLQTEDKGMKKQELKQALDLVKQNQGYLWSKWEEMHGQCNR